MAEADEQLILLYQQGAEEAFTALFGRYKTAILNYTLRLLGNRADAEDVTTEVFMVLLTNKNAYQPKAKFSTWLYTVARNASLSRLRKRRYTVSMWFSKESGEDYTAWDLPDPGNQPREEMISRETARQVRAAIFRLPQNQREALILREYQNLNYEEISQILHCSLENVKILIYRARETLKKDLSIRLAEGNHE